MVYICNQYFKSLSSGEIVNQRNRIRIELTGVSVMWQRPRQQRPSDRYRLVIDPTRKYLIDVEPMAFAIWVLNRAFEAFISNNSHYLYGPKYLLFVSSAKATRNRLIFASIYKPTKWLILHDTVLLTQGGYKNKKHIHVLYAFMYRDSTLPGVSIRTWQMSSCRPSQELLKRHPIILPNHKLIWT